MGESRFFQWFVRLILYKWTNIERGLPWNKNKVETRRNYQVSRFNGNAISIPLCRLLFCTSVFCHWQILIPSKIISEIYISERDINLELKIQNLAGSRIYRICYFWTLYQVQSRAEVCTRVLINVKIETFMARPLWPFGLDDEGAGLEADWLSRAETDSWSREFLRAACKYAPRLYDKLSPPSPQSAGLTPHPRAPQNPILIPAS